MISLYVERRSAGRMPVRTDALYCDGVKNYPGTILNISENGMLILIDDLNFPLDNVFVTAIYLQEEEIHVPVEIKRLSRRGNRYNGIGVRLVGISPRYQEFIKYLASLQ